MYILRSKNFTSIRDAKKAIKLRENLLKKVKRNGVDPKELTKSLDGKIFINNAQVSAGSRKPYSEKTWNKIENSLYKGDPKLSKTVINSANRVKKLTGGNLTTTFGLYSDTSDSILEKTFNSKEMSSSFIQDNEEVYESQYNLEYFAGKYKKLAEDFKKKFPKSEFCPSFFELKKTPSESIPVMNFSYDDQDWFNIGVDNGEFVELKGDLSWNWKNIKKTSIKSSKIKERILEILKTIEPEYEIKSDPKYKWFIQELSKF